MAKRLFTGFLIVCSGFLFTFLPFDGRAQGSGMSAISVSKSTDDLEEELGKLLNQRFKVKVARQEFRGIGGVADNALGVVFAESRESGTPRVVTMVNTRTMQKDKDGMPTEQIIGIFSIAGVKPLMDRRAEVLDFINDWNRQVLPVRLYLTNEGLVAANNIFVSKSVGIPANYFLSTFGNVTKAWQVILIEMKKRGLLAEG